MRATRPRARRRLAARHRTRYAPLPSTAVRPPTVAVRRSCESPCHFSSPPSPSVAPRIRGNRARVWLLLPCASAVCASRGCHFLVVRDPVGDPLTKGTFDRVIRATFVTAVTNGEPRLSLVSTARRDRNDETRDWVGEDAKRRDAADFPIDHRNLLVRGARRYDISPADGGTSASLTRCLAFRLAARASCHCRAPSVLERASRRPSRARKLRITSSSASPRDTQLHSRRRPATRRRSLRPSRARIARWEFNGVSLPVAYWLLVLHTSHRLPRFCRVTPVSKGPWRSYKSVRTISELAQQ